VTAIEVAVADEVVQGGPYGEPGDAEVERQLALGGDGLADRKLLDQVQHAVARLLLLAHKWYCPPGRCICGS